MLTNPLPYVEVNPRTTPSAVVILMHGFGADGHDFESIVSQLHLPANLPIRFVFPHAPQRAIAMMGGQTLRAWFDVGIGESFDLDGLKKSSFQIKDLIQQEIDNGVPSERIVLAGFSQGGAVALQTGLFFRKRLAGMLALSTFLPPNDGLGTQRSKANAQTPILVCHGKQDEVLPIALGKLAFESLQSFNYPVEWREYTMAHAVCPQQIQDISQWLQKILPC